MKYLATFLLTVFSSVFGFAVKYFSRKVAIVATVTVAMLSLTTAFYLTLRGLVTVAVAQITNEALLMGFFAIWPPNAELCITICLAADVAAFMYRYQVDLLRMVSSSS